MYDQAKLNNIMKYINDFTADIDVLLFLQLLISITEETIPIWPSILSAVCSCCGQKAEQNAC